MNALEKLVHRANEMDFTEQDRCLGDVFMPAQARKELARLQAAQQQVSEAIQKLTAWRDQAYPLEVFPEPDMQRARMLLAAGGVTMDTVGAHIMRFALSRVCEILADAQKGEQ